jgi:hypothetical protein
MSAEFAALWPQALDINTTEMAMACMELCSVDRGARETTRIVE